MEWQLCIVVSANIRQKARWGSSFMGVWVRKMPPQKRKMVPVVLGSCALQCSSWSGKDRSCGGRSKNPPVLYDF